MLDENAKDKEFLENVSIVNRDILLILRSTLLFNVKLENKSYYDELGRLADLVHNVNALGDKEFILDEMISYADKVKLLSDRSDSIGAAARNAYLNASKVKIYAKTQKALVDN
ncbi:hypothetical protein [Enterococcus sp. AZ180]|uniref:hypothetical protein n=1 Tax=Enterococcus sp. AZ180 TaxID=2774961 RepID=UPI003F1F4E4B